MDTRSPAARRARSTRPRKRRRLGRRSTKSPKTFSCDDAEPFHFQIKPDAVDDEGKRAAKRSDRPCEINWCAFHQIDPNAPAADAQREQRRENYEHDMQGLAQHHRTMGLYQASYVSHNTAS